MGVYVQNMGIKNCDYRAAIKPKKLLVLLIRLATYLISFL